MKVLAFVLVLVVTVGCGGGNSSGGNNGGGGGVPGINVQVTSPVGAAAVDGGQQLAITVTVSNDPANAGVTWSVAPAIKGGPVGTLTDSKSFSVTYNPPGDLSETAQVTVTATSVSDPTRSASIPISLYPAPSITTQSSDLATAFLNTDYTCIQMPITASGVIQIPCQVTVAGGMGPYTWSLGDSFLPDGLLLVPGLTANTTQIVGAPTLVGIYPFTLTVTDNLGVQSTASLSISVAPKQLKVVTPTLLTTVANVPYAPVAMQVSGGVPAYTWVVAPGSGPLPPGMTLSPEGVIFGTPTSQNGFPFAVRVRDSQTPVAAEAIFPTPAPTSPKIMVLAGSGLDPSCLAGGSTVLPATPYAFLFSGFDADGPVTLSGSFTADNAGNVTGVEDIVRTSTVLLAQPLTSGSSLAFNQVGRGCLTLNTATASAQFRLAETTIAQGDAGAYLKDGRIIEFDDGSGSGTRGSGFFRIQDSTAFSSSSINGGYAFRFSGWNASGGHFAIAGTATAESGLFTAVTADVNNAGEVSGALNGSGTIGSVDSNGRGTASISIGPASYDLIFYVLDANHLVFNSTQAASSGHPLISGEATSAVGPFSQASLSNSHIYQLGGFIPGSPDVEIGVLHFDGVGAVSGTSFERSGGTASATTLSGQYTVDQTTGRFVFSGTAVNAVGYATASADGITAYLVGTGSSASSGVMEFQTSSYPPGYQFSPINGRYGIGIDEVLDPQTTVFAGVQGADLNGNLSSDSYIDNNIPADPGLIPVQAFTMFRYTWSPDGSGTYGGNTYMVSNGAKIFYIDVSPLNGHPAVVVGQRVQ